MTRASLHLDRHRDARHHARVRIVWPTDAPTDVGDGRAVLLLHGWESRELTLIEAREGRVLGLRVSTAATREDRGEDPSTQTCTGFSVERAAFDRAWAAAHVLRGARAELRADPAGLERIGGSYGCGSQEPHRVVSLRDGSDAAPVHHYVRGRREHAGVRDFEQIRAEALHDLFTSLVPDAPGDRVPITRWRPFLHAFVCAHAEEISLEKREPTRVLLTTTLALLAVAGDRESATCVQTLQATLSRTRGNTFGIAAVQTACQLCLAKLDLRTRWDALRAGELLRVRPDRAAGKLQAWVRRAWNARDPSGYAAQVRADLAFGARTGDTRLTRDSLAALCATAGGLDVASVDAATVAALLAHEDPDVRVDAAIAVLDHDPEDAAARATLRNLAADSALDPPHWTPYADTARCRAVTRLARLERWTPDRFLALLSRPGEDARFVRWLAERLAERGAAVPDATLAATYRHSLEGPVRPGLLTAVQELVRLGEAHALDRMDARLDDLEEAWEIGEDDPIGRWNAQRTLPKLRAAIEERRRGSQKR